MVGLVVGEHALLNEGNEREVNLQRIFARRKIHLIDPKISIYKKGVEKGVDNV